MVYKGGGKLLIYKTIKFYFFERINRLIMGIWVFRVIWVIRPISLSAGSIPNCINKKREKLSFLSFLRGGYLLSHLRSTIGVVRFNFSVRDGKRWSPDAIAT